MPNLVTDAACDRADKFRLISRPRDDVPPRNPEVAALLRRAQRLRDMPGLQPDTRRWWEGYAMALADYSSGVGAAFALRDQAQGVVERAPARLPVGGETRVRPSNGHGGGCVR